MGIWVDDLLQEYTEGKKQLENHRNRLDRDNLRDMQDLIWIMLPAVILWIFSRSKIAWNLGVLLGLIGYFTIGPFSMYNIF